MKCGVGQSDQNGQIKPFLLMISQRKSISMYPLVLLASSFCIAQSVSDCVVCLVQKLHFFDCSIKKKTDREDEASRCAGLACLGGIIKAVVSLMNFPSGQSCTMVKWKSFTVVRLYGNVVLRYSGM